MRVCFWARDVLEPSQVVAHGLDVHEACVITRITMENLQWVRKTYGPVPGAVAMQKDLDR